MRLSLGLLLCFGCNTPKPPTQAAPAPSAASARAAPLQTGPAEVGVSRYVLLKREAVLYRTPNEEDEAFASIGYKIGESPPVTTFRVVSEQGGWLKVENLPGLDKDNPAVCAPLHEPGLGQLKLQLFVKRESLHPVLTKAVRQDFENGSRLELLPGLGMVAPDENDLRLIHRPRVSLAAAITDDVIGLSYSIAPPFPTRDEVAGPLNAVSIDTLDSGGVTFGNGITISGLNNLRVTPLSESDGVHLVELQRDCVRVRAMATKLSPIGSEGMLGSTVDTGDPSVEAQVAKVGAAIFWRDGSLAGSVVAYDLVLGHETEPAGETRCFQHELRDNTEERVKLRPAIELCFDAKTVVIRPPSNEKRGWKVHIETSAKPVPRSFLKHLKK